jgi:hypothetical protein
MRLRSRVTDLIAGWGHCDINMRSTILEARLLCDAPLGILIADYILSQHTHIATYINPNGDHTFNYIYQSNIT